MSKAETHPEIRETVRKLCARFQGPYWRALDRERAYPTEFVTALTEAGWRSGLIPQAYGCAGPGLSGACAVLGGSPSAGANCPAVHSQMHRKGPL